MRYRTTILNIFSLRNIVALILGILASYLSGILIFLFLITIGVIPLGAMLKAIEGSNPAGFHLFERYLVVQILIGFPLSSFITGILVGLVARDNKYWIGGASVLPIYITFTHGRFDIYNICSFFSFMVPVVIGVFLAKRAKKGWKERKARHNK